MRKFVLGALMLVLATGVAFGGSKRIETISGSKAVQLDAADSTGFISIMAPIQISEMSGGASAYSDRTWDRIFGTLILANLTPVNSDSVAGENAVDTLIVNYKFKTRWYTITAEADTVTLPGTTFFAIDDDIWADPTTTISIYGSDSSSAVAAVTPKLTGDWSALLMDQFWIEGYVSDTAGTNGTSQGVMNGTIYYEFKFYEDDED